MLYNNMCHNNVTSSQDGYDCGQGRAQGESQMGPENPPPFQGVVNC